MSRGNGKHATCTCVNCQKIIIIAHHSHQYLQHPILCGNLLNQNNNAIVAIIANSESGRWPTHQIAKRLQDSILWNVYKPNLQYGTHNEDVTAWLSSIIWPYPPPEFHSGSQQELHNLCIVYTLISIIFHRRLPNKILSYVWHKFRSQPSGIYYFAGSNVLCQ